MPLRVAIQMDSPHSLNLNGDSTIALAREAQERGHRLFCFLPENLSYQEGKIVAHVEKLSVESNDQVDVSPKGHNHLNSFHVVLLRQDPPFDMSYITTTHLLESIASDVLVVNHPFWVRNHPEKILALQFDDLIPPTSISRDVEILREFRSKHRNVIMKPLYGNGGVGVFLVREGDLNFNALCEMFLESSREPVIIQKYLPAVRDGDKRIILVNGKPIGALNRIPSKDESRSNLHVGGQAKKVELTPRDHEICARIGPLLAECGLLFVGIDVIGEFLTEINVTSPTGLVELQEFDDINAAGLVWDAIEGKVR